MASRDPLPLVYTAQSKRFFYCRDAVCQYVFSHHAIPVNPFRAFEYFLNDRVDRKKVRQANFNLIRVLDELWSFGDIADGVLAEIQYAAELAKPIRFFTIDTYSYRIRPLKRTELCFEPELGEQRSREELLRLVAAAHLAHK